MATWMDRVGVRRDSGAPKRRRDDGAPNRDGDDAQLTYAMRFAPNQCGDHIRRKLVARELVA